MTSDWYAWGHLGGNACAGHTRLVSAQRSMLSQDCIDNGWPFPAALQQVCG